ncbi:MAG TPA: HD domain-containing protein [Chitinophagales bacterium]|nr:HD domain-containing protein [Chitinophagales bacterium]
MTGQIIDKIPPKERVVLEAISEVSEETGIDSYAVGGYVRDILLRRPTQDIDIVCIGSGIEFARKVAKKFSPVPGVAVFKNFGTAMFKLDELEVEFVGARKESYSRHSRKPVVEGGTLQDDQNRRDFTINTLAFSLRKENFGELLDPFGGLEHLEKKIIKTPLDPDITFSDDPLRMMRAIRFANQLNFRIESSTLHAIQRNAHRIEIVSMERITDELNKIIMTDKPSTGFRLLFETGLLKLIFPEMVALQGAEHIEGRGHKDNFYHTLQVLDNLCQSSDNLWLRWAAILHDIGKPKTKRFDKNHGWTFHGHEVVGAKMVSSIFRRLRLPLNDRMKYVEKMVRLHLRPIGLNKDDITDSAIRRLLFDAGDDIDDLLKLCNADITTKNPEKMKRYLANFEIVRQKLKDIEEKDRIRNWQPPISGEEIMRYFNLKPSKPVGIIKDAIKEAILDGVIGNNYEEAFQFMVKKGKELGLELAVAEEQKNTSGNSGLSDK